MKLQENSTNTQGTGILSTAAASGEGTSAVSTKPHFLDAATVALIMGERLPYAHRQTNGYACSLFVEQGPGINGLRLFRQKIDHSGDSQLLSAMTRRHPSPQEDTVKGRTHLVCFEVVKVLPLAGNGPVGA